MAKISYRPTQFLAIGLLIIVHCVGVLGVLIPIVPDFMRLTPLNLLFSAVVVLSVHRGGDDLFGWALLMAFMCGMAIEWLGVHTGFPFGPYIYGATLGPKLAGVPYTIGLNWMILVYCTANIAAALKVNTIWKKALLGATLMTALDFLIEPAAVKYDFWTWYSPSLNDFIVAPWQNYAAWFVASYIILTAYHSIVSTPVNKTAIALFILQILFFAILYCLDY